MSTFSSAQNVENIASSKPGCLEKVWKGWKKLLSPDDISVAWEGMKKSIIVLTIYSLILTIAAIFCKNKFKIQLFSLLQVIPGWFALFFPIEQGRIVACWCFLFTNGTWAILNTLCFLYGFITAWKWGNHLMIPIVPAFFGALVYTLVLVQTWYFILLVSVSARRCLPTVCMVRATKKQSGIKDLNVYTTAL